MTRRCVRATGGNDDKTRRTIERVRAATAHHRRAETIRFGFPILGGDQLRRRCHLGKSARRSVARRRSFCRLVDAQHIRRATATRSGPSAENRVTVISGTDQTISLAILDYCDIRVTDFSVRGLRWIRRNCGVREVGHAAGAPGARRAWRRLS